MPGYAFRIAHPHLKGFGLCLGEKASAQLPKFRDSGPVNALLTSTWVLV